MSRPLSGMTVLLLGTSPAADAAGELLGRLGADLAAASDTAQLHDGALGTGDLLGALDAEGQLTATSYPVVQLPDGEAPGLAWAQSGAMALTGAADGPAVSAPWPLGDHLRGVAAVIELLSAAGGNRVRVDGPALLGERAAIAGLTRQGSMSPSGASRILPAADGWIAVSLVRPSDWDLAGAWLTTPVGPRPWESVATEVAKVPVEALVDRAALLGLAVATIPHGSQPDEQAVARNQTLPNAPFLVDGRPTTPRPVRQISGPDDIGPSRPAQQIENAPIADFSSLWAGPLATSLVGQAGAQVTKVESWSRPDGARSGPQRFFDLMNGGKRSVAVEFSQPAGRQIVADLISRSRVVVEASRPRAFAHLELGPHAVPDEWEGVWLSVTGYGRTGPWNNRPAFGDDAAVAGGLVIDLDDGPGFVADAAADPIAGLHAAAAILAALVGGWTGEIDLAMREAVSCASAAPGGPLQDHLAAPPRARPAPEPAPQLGTHNRLTATAAA